MKKRIALFAFCSLLVAPAFAYQVTGPVVEVTDSKIVVQKGQGEVGNHTHPGHGRER